MTVIDEQATEPEAGGEPEVVVAGDDRAARRRHLAHALLKGAVAAVVVLAALEELGYASRRLKRASAGWMATVHHHQRTRLSRDELAFLLERLASR
ncbi:MAG TPA: hypothetical protein VFJ85_07915 [Acidimicrobiales bacterium]|nr:hypothetical protein [Acidimicrobiales bacterium]